MVDVDMQNFEALLDKYIKENSVEKAVLQIIYPFLERIGMLWLTNNIHPAQEHLVSNIIRQKLILAIDQLPLVNSSKPALLMFLPEGELHEIGLIFMHYILRSKGIKILYVGANIPLKDIIAIVDATKVACIYCHLTSASEKYPLEKFLTKLTIKLPSMPAIISGSLLDRYGKNPPSGIHFVKSLPTAVAAVENILFKK
jgi:methanogenic corrinoid protein MtbC1